jgi:phytoene/squalene synthetase
VGADVAALPPVALELRAAAPERFTCALFAPAPAREALIALAAFEAATAKATLASQALAGLGRLAFWRDVVAGAGDGRRLSHPVADALRAAIVAHRLPASLFDPHLAAREALLTEGAFADLGALADHARDVSLPLLRLACQVLGAPLPAGADRAASGLGLVALLRDLIPLARAGRLALPGDACGAAGFGVQSLAEGRNLAAIRRVIETVAEAARAACAAADRPRAAVPAFLPLVPARAVLNALERAAFHPASAAAWQPGTGMRLAVLWAAATGRV